MTSEYKVLYNGGHGVVKKDGFEISIGECVRQLNKGQTLTEALALERGKVERLEDVKRELRTSMNTAKSFGLIHNSDLHTGKFIAYEIALGLINDALKESQK